MSSSVGQVNLDLGIDYRGFNRQLNGIANNAQSMVGGAFKNLGATIAAAFAVSKLIDFGNSAISLASDLQEVQNVVEVTFGSMAEDINNFSKEALEQFGLSELSAKRYTSTMGAMLKSSGLAGEQMKKMSMDLAGLSADMASFYNLSGDAAFNKIRAGISGEIEPLRQLGINMSVANLEAYALSKGIKKSYQAMNQAEQTLLRYNYLMSVTTDAQGDFARTSNSWANQIRLLGEQWKIFKTTLGQGFINVLTPVIGMLNRLIAKLQIAAQYFKAFTEMIFGAQKAIGNGAASAATAAASIGGMAEASSDVAKGIKDANKAMKGSVAGFDEINSLSQDTADSMVSMADGATNVDLGIVEAGKVDIGVSDETFAPLKKAFESVILPLKNISFQSLTESFARLKTALDPFKETLFAGLRWAWVNVITPIASFTIQQGLPTFLNLISGVMSVLNPLLLSFQPLGIFLWEKFLVPIAKWTGGVIITVLQGLADILTKIGNWMLNNQSIIEGFTTVVIGFFAAWKTMELFAFLGMSGGVIGAFKNITDSIKAATKAKLANKIETLRLTAMYAKDFVLSIANGTKALLAQAVQWGKNTLAMLASKAFMVALTIAQWAMTAATVAWNIAAGIAATVTVAFGAAIAFLTSPIGLVILALAALVAGIVLLVKNWDTVKEVAAKVWDRVAEIWGKVADWFSKTVIQPIADRFNALKDSMYKIGSDMFTFLFNGIKSVWNSISSWISDKVNWLTDKLSFWRKGQSEMSNSSRSSMGLGNISNAGLRVPKLARGGIIDQPTLAMVGERGKEAVVPLENTAFVDTLATALGNAVMAAMQMLNQSSDSSGENRDIIIQIEGTTIARIINPFLERERQRLGGPVVQSI